MVRPLREAFRAAQDADQQKAVLGQYMSQYADILGPAFKDVLRFLPGRHLKIFPRLQMNAIPFHALRLQGKYLIEYCASVSYGQTLALFLENHSAHMHGGNTDLRLFLRLGSEAADLDAEERSLKDKEHTLRALIAEFERQPDVEPPRVKDFDVHGVLSPGSSEAVVYPVWFGTNRKPTDDGQGFTGQRHSAISCGRVEILVPKSHKIGETGSSWWKRSQRFALRDEILQDYPLQPGSPKSDSHF